MYYTARLTFFFFFWGVGVGGGGVGGGGGWYCLFTFCISYWVYFCWFAYIRDCDLIGDSKRRSVRLQYTNLLFTKRIFVYCRRAEVVYYYMEKQKCFI